MKTYGIGGCKKPWRRPMAEMMILLRLKLNKDTRATAA